MLSSNRLKIVSCLGLSLQCPFHTILFFVAYEFLFSAKLFQNNWFLTLDALELTTRIYQDQKTTSTFHKTLSEPRTVLLNRRHTTDCPQVTLFALNTSPM